MAHADNASYQTKSAILFVIFNRPETTQRVFKQIKLAKPRRLYVAADAPRANIEGDDILCTQARSIINQIDWDCELKTLFQEKNMGCKDGVSAAVNWFFDNEEEGIILEDDCLPSNSFFKFCDTLLNKYRHDTRIRHITGCNLQDGKKWGNDTYYFSNRSHVWGWASWKRVWNDYDKTLNKYSNADIKDQLHNIFDDPLIVDCWEHIFEKVKAGQINSWAYQLDFANFFNNGLAIIPNENLISNIGFGSDATHTVDENNLYANIPVKEIDEITNPVFFLPEKEADRLVLNRDFNIEERRRRENRLRKRINRWAKSAFRHAAAYMFLS